MIDFDGTLISEHVLISWVLFLFRRSCWPAHRKIFFIVESVCRGLTAVIVSRRPGWAPWAVRTAFGAFRGVETEMLAALVHFCPEGRPPQKKYSLNLNPQVMTLLKRLVGSHRMCPEICVSSQGSCREIIEHFLHRSDVIAQFRDAGICTASVAIHANSLESDERGCLTGRTRGEIMTKFNRMDRMIAQTAFIGDDEDETVFKRMNRGCAVTFVNWRRWAGVNR